MQGRGAGRVGARQLLAFGARRALVTLLTVLCASVAAGPGVASAQAAPLSISIVGNRFVDASGQPIRLLGVDREGTEYACVKGTGYAPGPLDASEAAAIAGWHANAVRIPINEDCWLGINGLPAFGSAEGYQQAIENYVADLNAVGIYAILDLQWTAPGTDPAVGLGAMPDDHSVALWQSLAAAFLGDPGVVFDAFNEPYPGGIKNPDAYWSCWRDGGCALSYHPGTVTPTPYTAVGMQALVDAIRSTGATQPILLSGLAHANDLKGWLAYMPFDPDGQLAASIHIYASDPCKTTTCWDSTVAPVAAVVPVTVAEFGAKNCQPTLDDNVMQWSDSYGIGYLGWAWYLASATCHGLALISDWSGTPRAPNGTALYDHLSALAVTGPGVPLQQPDGLPVLGGAVEPREQLAEHPAVIGGPREQRRARAQLQRVDGAEHPLGGRLAG
ncbi:MAG: glycoside hydrolase family 5 protein [Solirubrobacteraceae bacterium]